MKPIGLLKNQWLFNNQNFSCHNFCFTPVRIKIYHFFRKRYIFYLNKLLPDEPLGETAVVVLSFYFILTRIV